jgi:creatinine amidohydrolase
MLLEDHNWMQVEDYLRGEDRLMFVIGACEQHGYLSLLTDIRIPMALAGAASEKTGVMVAPPLNFGISPSFATYPGSIGLRAQTMMTVVDEIVRGLHAQGFRRILFVNGHGGNMPVRAQLYELANALPGLETNMYSWWVAPSVTAIAERAGLESAHAAWIEAFPNCRVADLPEGAKPFARAGRFLSAEETRALYGDGNFGGPYSASDEIMDSIFAAAVDDIVDLLKFE